MGSGPTSEVMRGQRLARQPLPSQWTAGLGQLLAILSGVTWGPALSHGARPSFFPAPILSLLLWPGGWAHFLLLHLTPELLTFTGFFLVSGIYDLEPIVSTSNNALLLMTL